MKVKCNLIVRYIFIALSVAIMAVIFYFSSQNGERSGTVSGNVSQSIGAALPSASSSSGVKNFFIEYIRKFAHVFLYAGLGLCVSVAAFTFPLKHRLLYFALPALICLAYACSDEFHQVFVPGRDGSIHDVLVDCIGFLSAAAIANIVWFIINLIKNRAARPGAEKTN